MQRPNILVIMTDQQRFDSLGCYGCDFVNTPNLDALASQGVRYTNCYVNNPVCTPSRASILTGRHVNGHGVYKLHDILPENVPRSTVALKKKGYQTALIGKLHVSGRSFERDRRNYEDGFDVYKYAMTPHNLEGKYNSYGDWLKKHRPEFYTQVVEKGRTIGNIPEDCHFTYWAAEETIDFLKNRSPENPFYCVMSVVDPHDPYSDYPIKALKGIDEEKLPAPELEKDESHEKPDAVRRFHDHSYLGGFHAYSEEQIYLMRKGYYASIAFLDEQVGRVLQTLKREGLEENTLVVFMSDHGDMLADHELLAKGGFFYDPCVKVPCIMRLPGRIPKGTVIDKLIQPHDLGATCLKIAGYSDEEIHTFMPESCDLISAMEGRIPYRDYAVSFFRNTMINDEKVYFDPPIHATMLRKGKWKVTVYHNPVGSEPVMEGELYNMEADPKEKHNLWGKVEYNEIRNTLIGCMMSWFVYSDAAYHSGQGGELFPPKSQWSKNNPL